MVETAPGILEPLASAAPEVTFNAQDLSFTYAKCPPGVVTSDPDCAEDAFFFDYDIVLKAELDDYEETTSLGVEFVIGFGPDCTGDEVSFSATIPNPLDYSITTPAQPLPIVPTVTQLVPNCPITCTLTQNGQTSPIDDAVESFSATTGALTILTSDLSKDQSSLDMQISCSSSLSVSVESEEIVLF